MSRSKFAVVGLSTLVGCAAQPADSTPYGLVISVRTSEVVAGTFRQNGDTLRFDFSDRHGNHEAVLTDAQGDELEDVVFVDGGIDGTSFVEAILLGGKAWVVSVQGNTEPQVSGDPSTLDELAARPEMQLVAPLQAALADAGIQARAASTPLMPTLPSVDLYVTDGSTWSWSTIYLADAP